MDKEITRGTAAISNCMKAAQCFKEYSETYLVDVDGDEAPDVVDVDESEQERMQFEYEQFEDSCGDREAHRIGVPNVQVKEILSDVSASDVNGGYFASMWSTPTKKKHLTHEQYEKRTLTSKEATSRKTGSVGFCDDFLGGREYFERTQLIYPPDALTSGQSWKAWGKKYFDHCKPFKGKKLKEFKKLKDIYDYNSCEHPSKAGGEQSDPFAVKRSYE